MAVVSLFDLIPKNEGTFGCKSNVENSFEIPTKMLLIYFIFDFTALIVLPIVSNIT